MVVVKTYKLYNFYKDDFWRFSVFLFLQGVTIALS